MVTNITSVDDIAKFLNKNPKNISNMQTILNITQKKHKSNVDFNFCLIRCDKNTIREEDFIDFLFKYIVKYALNYSEYHPKKLTEEEINDWWIENAPRLTSKAKGAFLKKNDQSGELAELFLFIALESQGFIRLINKMSLKTSKELYFQGWDAVHIGADINDNLLFCLGSSKMFKQFSRGFNDAFQEIEDFTTDVEKEKIEVDLISSYIDSERFEKYAEEIPKILSPYYPNKEKVGRAHSIFLGYEWKFLKKINLPKTSTLDNHVRQKFSKNQQKIIKKIDEKISELTVASNRDFNIWIMPFRDVKEIRSKFVQKLRKP